MSTCLFPKRALVNRFNFPLTETVAFLQHLFYQYCGSKRGEIRQKELHEKGTEVSDTCDIWGLVDYGWDIYKRDCQERKLEL